MASAGGVRLDFNDSIITRSSLPPTKPAAPTNGTRPRTPEDNKPSLFTRQDLPESALDGRLGELYQRRLSDLPRAYAYLVLVTGASVMIPRVADPHIRPNLYTCLVGAKGSGKSQSFDQGYRLLGLKKSPLLIEGRFGSAEGLFEHVKGETNAARLVSTDELGHLLTKVAIDRSSFSFILNSAFYNDTFSGGTKGKLFEWDCRLSIAGGIPEDEFSDYFGASTVGGLYDRFLYGLCPQPFQCLYRPFEGSAEVVNPIPPDVASDVWDCRDAWVKYGMAPRVAELALRVAYIAAAVDGRPVLHGKDLNPALQLAEYETKLRRFLTPNEGLNPDAKCAEKIRAWLRDKAPNGEWIKRTDLARGINANRFGPGVFNRCLLNLQFSDEIELDEKARTVRLLR